MTTTFTPGVYPDNLADCHAMLRLVEAMLSFEQQRLAAVELLSEPTFKAADEITRLKSEVERLVADLARFDAELTCEGCGAPLFDGDDYVSDPNDCSGCWFAMTDLPSKRERPCFAYRVGKPDARARSSGKAGSDAGVEK